MFKLVALMFLLSIGSLAYSQDSVNHEPTSATDGGVKLQKTKRFRFQKSTRARKTENRGEAVKAPRARAEVRETERHGKSVQRSKNSKKLNGEARVFRRHGSSSASASSRKSKARRSLGRD